MRKIVFGGVLRFCALCWGVRLVVDGVSEVVYGR